MSTLGPQGIAPDADHGEWELIGRDMIRTNVRRGDNGQPTGGQIIAQFWTSPTREHAALMVAAPNLLAALTALTTTLRNCGMTAELMTGVGMYRDDAGNVIHWDMAELVASADAAIAKAKGAAS